MVALPNFFLAKNMSVITLTGCTVAADGTITVGTSRSVLGVIRTDDMEFRSTTEELSVSSSGQDNYIRLSYGPYYDFEGLIKANDAQATQTINSARYISENFETVQLVRTMFGVTRTIYGLVKMYKEGVKDKGGLPFSFSLEPVDIGAANPAIS